MTFEQYYDSEYIQRGAYFVHHRQRFLQTWEAVEALGRRAGRVLDAGGVGPVACYLGLQGWEVHGSSVDLRGPLPFSAGWFDLILCTEVIEHIKDLDSRSQADLEAFNYSGVRNMLQEQRRTLRPDGALLITTPNASAWHMLAKWLYGEVLLADPQHVREFTPADLERVATDCGLRLVSMKVIESWGLGRIPAVEAIERLLHADPTLPAIDRGDNLVAVFARE